MKKILGLLAMIFFAAQAYASVSVAPTRIEIGPEQTKSDYVTVSIDVKGDQKEPTRLKVTSGYFKINEEGRLDMSDEYTGDAHDLSKQIKFVPSEFNVLPGKSQKLRVNVVGLRKLPDGESRALLFIEDVDSKEYDIPTGKSGMGAQLVVRTRIGVPIYVEKGKCVKKAEIEDLKTSKEADGYYTELKIASTGNCKIRYSGKAQIIKDKTLVAEYQMPEHAVGHGSHMVVKDRMKTDDIKDPGEYTLRTVLSYDDASGKKQVMKRETSFKYEGPIEVKNQNPEEAI